MHFPKDWRPNRFLSFSVLSQKYISKVCCVSGEWSLHVTQHVAQNTSRPGGSALGMRNGRYAGYYISQKRRNRIEECFGWLNDIAAA